MGGRFVAGDRRTGGQRVEGDHRTGGQLGVGDHHMDGQCVVDGLRRGGQCGADGHHTDGQCVVGGLHTGFQLGAGDLQRDGLRAERGQNFGCWGERMRVAERHQTLQSQDVHFVRQAASQRAWAWAHLVRRWAVVCVNSRCKGSVLANWLVGTISSLAVGQLVTFFSVYVAAQRSKLQSSLSPEGAPARSALARAPQARRATRNERPATKFQATRSRGPPRRARGFRGSERGRCARIRGAGGIGQRRLLRAGCAEVAVGSRERSR